jgi:DNA-binding beta-propeller fold protein YncE
MTGGTGSANLAGLGLLLAFALAAAPVLAQEAVLPIDSSLVIRGVHGSALANPAGVAVDPSGHEVVVANTAAGRVEFFDAGGYPTGGFLHMVPGPDGHLQRGQPIHVATRDGDVYVVDAFAAGIDVCDYRGRLLRRITLPAPDDARTRGGAGALALLPDGGLLVGSRGFAGHLYEYDRDFHLVAAWGDSGLAAGQLSGISGIAVTDSHVVVTCLLTQQAVQVFDRAGHYVRGFGIHEIGPGNFSQPTGVVVTPDGRVWVSDAIRANVQVFDPTGTFLGAVTSGQSSGDWLYPSALATDGQGMFALTEMWGNRVNLLWIR